MSERARPRRGVLVIRASVDPSTSESTRVEVIEMRTDGPDQIHASTTSVHEASESVRLWLDAMVADRRGGSHGAAGSSSRRGDGTVTHLPRRSADREESGRGA